MKKNNLEKFVRDLMKWVNSDITPCHKGIRDLNGNVIDSPQKVVWLNSTDIKNAGNLQNLLKNVKKTSELTAIGERKQNGLSTRYMDPVSKKIYDVPLSRFTLEPMPKHYADVQDRIVLVWGDVSSGKTLLTASLIVKMQNIFNFHSANRRLLYSPDATQFDWLQKGYHYHRDIASIANGEVPRPTEDVLQQFPLYFESTFNGIIHKAILKFVDLPGEYGSGEVEHSLPKEADCLWSSIDGEDFFTNPVKTRESFKKLHDLFEVFPTLRKIPIYIILTKADRVKNILFENMEEIHPQLKPLFEEDFHFKTLFPENSILNSACTKSVHTPTFNIDARNTNARFTEALMCALYRTEYLHLKKYNVKYITVSSLSENPINGKIPERNQPFGLDELLFDTLRNFDLY